MPRIVDHDQRRENVADAVLRLIAQSGVESVTIRSIAKELGYSTAVVQHYFENKQQVMLFTYHKAAKRARDRSYAILARDPGDIWNCARTLLPLTHERWLDCHVWLAFKGIAIADPEFASEQRRAVFQTRSRFEGAIRAAQADGRLNPQADAAMAARRLLAFIQGMSAEAVFDTGDWPPERQQVVLDMEIAALAG